MGKAPLKPCRHPGCREYASENGFCEKHKSDKCRFFEVKRPSPSKLGYNRKWNAARKEFLKQFPLCRMCGRPATEVDHVIPHKGNMILFWDRNNWQPLCHSCHSKKTFKENNYFK